MKEIFEKFDRESLYYFRSLAQTQEENEYSTVKEKNTAALENIFIGITSLVIISLAPNGWVLFVGACSGFLGTLSAIVIRSLLSKVTF